MKNLHTLSSDESSDDNSFFIPMTFLITKQQRQYLPVNEKLVDHHGEHPRIYLSRDNDQFILSDDGYIRNELALLEGDVDVLCANLLASQPEYECFVQQNGQIITCITNQEALSEAIYTFFWLIFDTIICVNQQLYPKGNCSTEPSSQ